jgi:hypothetical protein
MSSPKASIGAGAIGEPNRRKRGRPLGRQNKVRDPAVMPPFLGGAAALREVITGKH